MRGGSVPPVQESEPMDDAARREKMLAKFEELKEKFSDSSVPNISTKDVEDLDKGTTLIVDVRPPGVRKISRIPGSITKEDFEAKRKDGSIAGKTIVTTCSIGYASGIYAKDLVSKDTSLLGRVKNHKGSMMDWCHAGNALEDDNGEPTRDMAIPGKNWEWAFPTTKGYNAVIA